MFGLANVRVQTSSGSSNPSSITSTKRVVLSCPGGIVTVEVGRLASIAVEAVPLAPTRAVTARELAVLSVTGIAIVPVDSSTVAEACPKVRTGGGSSSSIRIERALGEPRATGGVGPRLITSDSAPSSIASSMRRTLTVIPVEPAGITAIAGGAVKSSPAAAVPPRARGIARSVPRAALRVRSMSIEPALSVVFAGPVIVSSGCTSSSRIVIVALDCGPRIAPLGAPRVTTSVSSGSKSGSSTVVIESGAPVTPAGIVIDAGGGLKSSPAVAVPPMLTGITTALSDGTVRVAVRSVAPPDSERTARVGVSETTGVGSSSRISTVRELGVPRSTCAAGCRVKVTVCVSSATKSLTMSRSIDALVVPAGKKRLVVAVV